MTTENNFSDNQENEAAQSPSNDLTMNDASVENTSDAKVDEKAATENNLGEALVEEHAISENNDELPDHAEFEQNIKLKQPSLSKEQILRKIEKLINLPDAGAHHKEFSELKEQLSNLISAESRTAKANLTQDDALHYVHPYTSKLNVLEKIYREKQTLFHKNQEQEQRENLKNRQQIIEQLKNLYTNASPDTNLFKAIREIKEAWSQAGMVPKNDFKLLNNNYFFHLQQFYDMLDMNKEFLHQEYAHNLEKRHHIIARAKELITEPSVQKALNELQYLHKLWKEEAEPVAEEFRETTWQEFKTLSNTIHDRKAELYSKIEEEQAKNLNRKNEILAKIKHISTPQKEVNHNYWQQSIKKIEDLRTEFLKLGSVPKKISSQNWAEFKNVLREFNSKKNDFYKSLKNSQQNNLDRKRELIQAAKDNMNSEDWEIAVPLFKNLQEEWKKIGHVPRSQADKVWTEFRSACNTFFNRFREKNNISDNNWKENLHLKTEILTELKTITNEDGTREKLEQLKNNWNKIGKVPKENLNINSEFNKTLREKLKLNKINEFDLKEEGLSETQLSDKARKIKNQISDLESEIVKLENNLGFFADASRDNPLLKDTFDKIDDKKEQVENLKNTLHTIISGE